MGALEILALVAAVIGVIGGIIPGIPGPPVSWVGLLLVYIAGCTDKAGDPMSTTFLIVWLVVTVLVTVLDYVIPAKFTRLTGGHKQASRGAILGLFLGLIVPPVGMILGSLLGAFIAELFVTDKGVWGATKASLGAFLGFILTTGMKFIVSGVMAYYIIVYVF